METDRGALCRRPDRVLDLDRDLDRDLNPDRDPDPDPDRDRDPDRDCGLDRTVPPPPPPPPPPPIPPKLTFKQDDTDIPVWQDFSATKLREGGRGAQAEEGARAHTLCFNSLTPCRPTHAEVGREGSTPSPPHPRLQFGRYSGVTGVATQLPFPGVSTAQSRKPCGNF